MGQTWKYLVGASSLAAQANNVSLGGVAGKMTYLTGFEITGLGATAGSTISVTIGGTGLATPPTFSLTIPAGATTAITPLNIYFPTPIPASAVGQAITVNVPSFGAGNTAANVVAHGELH